MLKFVQAAGYVVNMKLVINTTGFPVHHSTCVCLSMSRMLITDTDQSDFQSFFKFKGEFCTITNSMFAVG